MVKSPQPRWLNSNLLNPINLIASVAAISIIGVLSQYWLDRTNYRRGETAYEQRDCEAAIPHFQLLTEAQRIRDFNDYQARSLARIEECRAYLEVTTSASAAPTQLMAYSQFLDRYSTGPLAALIQNQATTLVTETDPSTLAEQSVCDRRENLMEKEMVPTKSAPELWMACGQAYIAEADYGAGILAYQWVLENSPDHALASQAEAALAQAMVSQAKAEGSGEISQPGWSGYTGSEATEVTIRNDSPEQMRIVFSGPETRFEEIAPCEDCEKYVGQGPESCPNKGPVMTFTLQAGDYDVLVRSISDARVTPFTGEWSLGQGEGYNSCFYLVQTLFPKE